MQLLCRLARRHPKRRIHVLNLSSSQCLPLEQECRQQGGQLTMETCPHYLALAAEEVPECGTEFKTWPPIRELGNQERLWQELRVGGAIRMIGSDHSPATPGARALTCGRGRGDFLRAWPGINSLQLSLPVVWTAANQRGELGDTSLGYYCVGNIKYTHCARSRLCRMDLLFREPLLSRQAGHVGLST